MPSKKVYKQVKVNFTPEHFEKLEQFSSKKGVSKAEYIRQRLNIEYEDMPQPKGKAQTKEADPKLIYELSRIGANLNQIARYANTNKALDREILSALVRIEDVLKTVL